MRRPSVRIGRWLLLAAGLLATPHQLPAQGRRAISPIPASRVRSDTLRFSTSTFTPGGLAYDVASRRFVIGDLGGRRVMVVGVDTQRAVDMVRADSARFQEVVDLGIDTARGDLWVSSGSPAGDSALHRLQLISGRPLRLYRPATHLGSVRLGELAVAPSGRVVVLDVEGRRLMSPEPHGLDLRRVADLDVEPMSVTIDAEGSIAYVAHARGIVRVDVERGVVTDLTSAAEGALSGFARIRSYRDGLIGFQQVEGELRLAFVPLRRRGATAGIVSVMDVSVPAGTHPPFVTVTDDEVSYLLPPSPTSAVGSPSPTESVIHRIRLE